VSHFASEAECDTCDTILFVSIAVNKSCENQLEIFETVQGEGTDMGLPAFFIRLQGCSVHCFFCDEKDTWVRRDNNALDLQPLEIVKKLETMNPLLKRVVITGGEPTEQNLQPLISELIKESFKVSIETAGTGEYCYQLFEKYGAGKRVSITFSPKELYSKSSKLADDRIWGECSELKFVVATNEASDYVISRIIPKLAEHGNDCPIFLTPDWYNMDATKSMIIKLLREYPSRFRMGCQLHKIIDMP
jgi:7-carboxy-7-deazaguanine synthase